MKKIMCAVLSVSMVLSMMAFSASAAAPEPDVSGLPVGQMVGLAMEGAMPGVQKAISENVAGVDRHGNPYYYVTETDPSWRGSASGVITEAQALVQTTVINILADICKRAATNGIENDFTNFVIGNFVEGYINHLNDTVLGSIAGTYTIKTKYKTQYAVRFDTGARHVENRWLVVECKLYQNGEEINSYPRELTLR